MSEWTVVLRGDFWLPHLVNMLDEYRGNSEQRLCADEMIEQIREQMIPKDGHAVYKTTRPLLVIDPEDREQVRSILDAYYADIDGEADRRVSDELAENMQSALRTLVQPEDPEPTGLGAVVEDSRGVRYVRVDYPRYPWHRVVTDTDDDPSYTWNTLPRPLTVLSTGWEES